MAQVSQYSGQIIDKLQATILSGQTESNNVRIGGTTLVMIYIPAGFDGTELHIKVSVDNGASYAYLYNVRGEQVIYQPVPDTFMKLATCDFFGVTDFKLVSNATESSTRELLCIPEGV